MRDFDKLIWRDSLMLVDFFAGWCGPCRMMHPIIDRFEEEMRGRVEVYKIDIDNREMADVIHRYNILSVPTLIFFRRGEILWRESGCIPYEQLCHVFHEIEQREPVTPYYF